MVSSPVHLATLYTALEHANAAARAYHSSIGHIAVEVDPEFEVTDEQ